LTVPNLLHIFIGCALVATAPASDRVGTFWDGLGVVPVKSLQELVVLVAAANKTKARSSLAVNLGSERGVARPTETVKHRECNLTIIANRDKRDDALGGLDGPVGSLHFPEEKGERHKGNLEREKRKKKINKKEKRERERGGGGGKGEKEKKNKEKTNQRLLFSGTQNNKLQGVSTPATRERSRKRRDGNVRLPTHTFRNGLVHLWSNRDTLVLDTRNCFVAGKEHHHGVEQKKLTFDVCHNNSIGLVVPNAFERKLHGPLAVRAGASVRDYI
jgi:hypothetical protein